MRTKRMLRKGLTALAAALAMMTALAAPAFAYTYDRRLIKKLDALCRKCPEEVYEEKKRSSAGAKSYIVPKSCVSVREPFSRARREAASRRAKEAGTVPPDRSKGRVSD